MDQAIEFARCAMTAGAAINAIAATLLVSCRRLDEVSRAGMVVGLALAFVAAAFLAGAREPIAAFVPFVGAYALTLGLANWKRL